MFEFNPPPMKIVFLCIILICHLYTEQGGGVILITLLPPFLYATDHDFYPFNMCCTVVKKLNGFCLHHHLTRDGLGRHKEIILKRNVVDTVSPC